MAANRVTNLKNYEYQTRHLSVYAYYSIYSQTFFGYLQFHHAIFWYKPNTTTTTTITNDDHAR